MEKEKEKSKKSCSSTTTTTTTTTSSSSWWSTREELLLACAVKRHGLEKWESVSWELQNKTSLPFVLTTPDYCKQKYYDLNRRFTLPSNNNSNNNNNNVDNNNNNNNNNNNIHIPWLDDLTSLHVAELKQELQRYDVSILSLQLKLKRLEEERQRSFQDKEEEEPKPPDLKQPQHDISENDTKETQQKVSISTDDRENRSVNESNSTDDGDKGVHNFETDAVGAGSAEEEEEEEEEEETEKGEVSCKLSESGGSQQLSGEVQSSPSLGRRRRRRRTWTEEEVGDGGGGGGGHTGRGYGMKGSVGVESEPLIRLLELIRAHQHGSFFEAGLQSEETEEYRNMVRQHLDLERIQTRLEHGSYSSSTLSFYRDLLLLFNNAIVVFPKSSIESLSAHELRSLVSTEMKKETQRSDSTPLTQDIPTQPRIELEGSDSLLAKHKASIPIIFSRKRSSKSAVKPLPSSSGQKAAEQPSQQESSENKPAVVEQNLHNMKSSDKPVTGARSSRRSTKNPTKVSGSPIKKQNAGPGSSKVSAVEKPETPKSDNSNKKAEALASDKKRSAAADFLKRIKKNSPLETTKKKSNRGGGSSGKDAGTRKKDNGGKVDKGKERVLRRKGDKKQAKDSPPPSKRKNGRPSKEVAEARRAAGKRGRESGGKEAAKKPRKRSRR